MMILRSVHNFAEELREAFGENSFEYKHEVATFLLSGDSHRGE